MRRQALRLASVLQAARTGSTDGDGVGTAYTSRLLVNAEEWTAPGESQRRDRRGDDAGYDAHSRK